MADIYVVEVVTVDPSNKKIFVNGNVSEKTDEYELFRGLLKSHWALVSSHAYVKGNIVHEKYDFVQS